MYLAGLHTNRVLETRDNFHSMFFVSFIKKELVSEFTAELQFKSVFRSTAIIRVITFTTDND